jgi:Fe-S-cluster containining protein
MAQDNPTKVTVYKEMDQEPLTLDSRFTFQCHEGLACFNRCCRTATIMLSPYEVLRLSRNLGLATREFLTRYTRREMEGQSDLPLVFIDLSQTPGGGCPFVGESGCQVYPQRPAACRLFPITMGSRLSQRGIEDFYFCRKLEFCRGFEGGEEWTVASWQKNQGFIEYVEARRQWLEILLRQGLQGPLAAEARVLDLIFALMYDPDTFRRLAGAPVFRQTWELENETLESLQRDDLALLNFSCRFLTDFLFTEGRLAEIQARLADWLAANTE